MDQHFKDILAGWQEDYDQAQILDNWQPPDGDYTAQLFEFNQSTKTTDEGEYEQMITRARILAEGQDDIHGREFRLGYYTRRNLGQLKTHAAAIAGRPLPNPVAAAEVLEKACSEQLVITIHVGRSKGKNNRIFVNYDITGVATVQSEPAPAADAVAGTTTA